MFIILIPEFFLSKLYLHGSRHPPPQFPLHRPGKVLQPTGLTPGKRLLNLIQTPSPRLRHKDPTHQGRDKRARAEPKVRAVRCLGQQRRRHERDEEIAQPVAAVRDAGGAGSRALRLDLRGVDLDADRPGDAVEDGEDVDGDNDDPATGAGAGVDGAAGVQAANEEHGGSYAEAAEDGVGAAAPSVGEDGGGDCDGEDDDGGNARGEEGGFVGGEASLLEEERGILRSYC